jgi:transposase
MCKGNFAVIVRPIVPYTDLMVGGVEGTSRSIDDRLDRLYYTWHNEPYSTHEPVEERKPMTDPRQDAKVEALKAERCFNLNHEAVCDPAFATSEFLDPRDLMQVKYEMVRKVRIDGDSVSHAVTEYGFSRPSFYEAALALDRHGLAGLIPVRPGPRRAHKMSVEVVSFVQQLLEQNPDLRALSLVAPIEENFGIRVHPRSIERALARLRQPKSGDPR